MSVKHTYFLYFTLSFPLEMHMVHIEDKFINFTTGEYDIGAAVQDPLGLAVLGMFFQVDNIKPQVCQ